MAKAYGQCGELAYDRQNTDVAKAIGNGLRPTEPRYTKPVDLIGVWQIMQQHASEVVTLPGL